ncbi:MAG: hypothetical protein FWD06_00890 [Oscillospiraceae bacterium]|nr:hypothetical protein [Oscillospiraceae bacterium]
MKRIFQLALITLLAVALMLPAAAIINTDGSDPNWDGVEGIVPAMNDIISDEYDETANHNDDYLGYVEVDEHYEVPERHPLARNNEDYAEIEPISAETGGTNGLSNTMAILIYSALGLALFAVLLSIIALVNAGRKSSRKKIKNDFF